MSQDQTTARRHGVLPRLLRGAAIVAVASVVAAGCSRDGGDRPPVVTFPNDKDRTTTSTTPLAPEPSAPTTTPPSAPLPLAWVQQVGGLGGDDLTDVAARNATVVAVGSTDGATRPTAGGRDAFSVVVGTDGKVRHTNQFGEAGTDRANGVAAAGAATLTCGTRAGALGGMSAGSTDGWCATVTTNGAFGAPSMVGGDADDALVAATLSPGASAGRPQVGYSVGSTSGVVPGAEDPSGRGLGDGDAIVVQTDTNGGVRWIRQFGSFAADQATAVSTTEDGDAVVASVTQGDAAGDSRGGSDGVVSRFDPNGNQRWSTQIGSAGEELLSAVAVAGSARRGTERCVAGGTTTGDLGGASAGGADALVTALGPDGAALWTAHWGSSGGDRVSAMVVDGPVIYVAGTTDGRFGDLRTELGPGGKRDGFVAAINAEDGKVLWTNRFGSVDDDTVTGITRTEDGLLVLSGTTAGQLNGAKRIGGTDGFLVAFRLPGASGAAGWSV